MRWLVPVVLVCLPLVASAAEEPEKPQKHEETIVVTATRSERAVSELPISTTVVSEEQIQSTPAHTIDDVLRTIPGVNMPLSTAINNTVQSQRFSMRGLGGTRALVLLDGIPMHDPFYGTVEWQKVPLDTLKQAEVVRGANASLFGNYALGGTINLLTRPVDASLVRLDGSYGTNATQHQSLSIDQLLTDKVSARVSHNRFSTNGTFRQPIPGNIDVPGWNDTVVTSARLELKPREGTTAYLKTDLSQIDVSQGTRLSEVNRDIADFAAGVQHATTPSSLLMVSAFHQRENMHIASSSTIGNRESEYIGTDSHIPGRASGASLEWSTQRRGALPFLSVGMDVQEMKADENAISYNRNGVQTLHDIVSGHQKFAGLFAQVSWQPGDHLEVLTSARVDYFSNEGNQHILGGATNLYPSTTSTQVDPRVSVRYGIGQRSAIRAAAYRGFKAPTLRELYRNTQSGITQLLANPYLEPETLLGADLGFEWVAASTHFEVNVFRNDIDGLQVRSPVPGQGPNVVRNINVGKGRSQGLELMANMRLSQRFSVDAGYAYTDSTIVENDIDPTLEGKQVPDVAKHLGSLTLRFRALRGTSVDLRGRVLSRSYGEPANVVPAPAHRVVDVSVSHPIRDWADAYASLENAFDEQYFYVLTPTSFRTGQSRTVSAGMRMKFPTAGWWH